jgi:HK97 family phage major capsid protein
MEEKDKKGAENKSLSDLVMEAVTEMRNRGAQMDQEIKKLGEPMNETKASYLKVNSRIDELLTSIKAETKAREDMELKMQRQTLLDPNASAKGISPEAKARKDAFYKFVRRGDQALSPEEKKALVEDATGQYIIEPELDAEIERILPKITIIRGLATVRTIGKDRIKMRSMGAVAVGWGKLETGADIIESDLTPGAPTYQYVEDLYGLAKIGEDELADSDVNLEVILAEEFARALGETEEAAFVVGLGHTTYNQPEGITKNATLIANTITGATINVVVVDDFLNMMYGCPTQFRRNGVFIMNSATELAIRKLRAGGSTTTDGPYLWQPSVQMGLPSTFLGRPTYTQDDMKTLTDVAQVISIFGDIKAGYRIIDRVGMTLQRLTELYAEAGLVGFKIHKRVTGGVTMASQKPIVLLTEHS